jgi:hypothetical protein
MKLWKRHNSELGRTETVSWNGRVHFTDRAELAGGIVRDRATFTAGGIVRTFAVRQYPNGIAVLETSGSDGEPYLREAFPLISGCRAEFRRLVSLYSVDIRWKYWPSPFQRDAASHLSCEVSA